MDDFTVGSIAKTSGDISPPGHDQMTGWGKLNIKALLDYYGVGSAPPAPPPDVIEVKLKKGQKLIVTRED